MKKELLELLIKIDKRIKIKDLNSNYSVDNLPYWDSLLHVNFLMAIEDEFKIQFTTKEMTTLKSIDEIVEALRNKVR